MSNDDSDKKPPVPSFSGHAMPMNISTDVDEDELGEETVRRIGAPSFQPSFEPVSFSAQPFSAAPTFSTAPQKASAAPTPVTMAMKSGGKPSGWKLVDAPILPEFHPLDRTATFVARTSATTVAQRISDILRERSIDASFDSMKAKVTCRTADNVDFRIRLYRGRNKYSHGIIVEVQRRFGSSVGFCEDSTAILDAAQGKVPPPPPSLGRSGSSANVLPPVSDVEDDEEDDASAASISSLDFVAKMFRHPGLDSHLLALQTLSSLTDPAKMGAKTAKAVSKALLDGASNEIGNEIVTLVATDPSRGAAIDEDDDGRRLLALTILSNALTVAGYAVVPLILRERVRPVLLKDLASNKTQMAFLAARCIEAMLDGDHDLGELHVAMQKALATGEARHASLYKQAKVCMEKIERRLN